MPKPIKILISIITLVVAIIFAYIQNAAGNIDVSWVAVFIGVFAVFAMWIFPETDKN